MTNAEAAAVLQAEIDRIEDWQAYTQLSKVQYEDGYKRIAVFKVALAALNSLTELSPYANALFEAVSYNGHNEMVNAISDFWKKWDELGKPK